MEKQASKKPRKKKTSQGLKTLSPCPVKKADKRNWRELLALLPEYDCFHNSEGFVFDESRAERVCSFVETQLIMIEGNNAGKPFVLLPWQAAFLGCLFGWVDGTGARRYRETMLYIPRKCGKSPLAAAILDYVLLCDNEEGAQCYCAAADREQASIVYRHARGMLERGDGGKYVQMFNSTKQIVFGQSFARVISAEAASKHGYNSHMVIIDELHAQPDRELVDVLITSTSTRRQPIVMYLTTADYDRPSICNERYEYACKVRDGLLKDPRFLPVIYEAKKEDDWESEDVWRKANPSIGITKTLDYMRRECERAKAEPSYQATFRRLELNQRTDVADVWLQVGHWDACKGELREDMLHGAPCWGGLDLSTTTDLTAFALCWVLPGDVFAFRWWHWIPEECAREREKRDRVPYATWRAQGYIEATPGNVVDYAFIRAKIRELSRKYSVKEIAFDPWNATQTSIELGDADGIKMEEFRQGYITMSPAAKDFERRIASGKILHEGNPLMRWQASHVVVMRDPAGNIKPDKSKATRRIDGIVAAIMACGMAQSKYTAGRSVYEERGIRTL